MLVGAGSITSKGNVVDKIGSQFKIGKGTPAYRNGYNIGRTNANRSGSSRIIYERLASLINLLNECELIFFQLRR